MSDNTVIPLATGGDTIRDLARTGGTVKTQVMQLDIGGPSANTEVLVTAGQQAMAASLPVAIASDQPALPVSGTFWQGTQPISGAVSVANFPAGFLAAQSGAWSVAVSNFPATQPVSGTVAVSNFPATQPVSGTFWQATQPVSGTVAVTGTFWQATQPVSIASMPSTPVTGTFWQATQPVSIAASVAITAAALPLPAGASTETTLAALNTKTPALGSAASAAATPVVIASDQPALAGVADLYITGQGSQTTLGNNIVNAVAGAGGTDCIGYRQIALQINVAAGTVTAGRVFFEASNDNASWVQYGLYDSTQSTSSWFGSTLINPATTTYWSGPLLFRYFRVRISTAVTGTTTGLQCLALLRPAPYAPWSQVVTSNAGNFPVTLTSGTVTTVTTVTTANTLAKAPTSTNATLSSAATTNATSVKASSGQLFSVSASNVGAAAAFLKLYNKASAPTVGTDVPVLTIPIAANGLVALQFGTQGQIFATGIAFAITNLAADSDTTAVVAAQVKVMLAYV